MTDTKEKNKLEKFTEHKNFYKRSTGKELDIIDPKDFNEKIQWLILNYYGPKEGELADKEKVKSYVSKLAVNGLKIPKTLKTYTDAKDINLDELPEKFVLKCNHYSGDVFICKDKKHFDLATAQKRLNEILKKDFASINLEYHYSHIKPIIMAEEYLNDGKHKNPLDYKFYCFNGKAESILVCSNRENKLKLNDFDLDWNELDYTTDEYRSNEKFKRPEKLKEMTRIAEELSKNLPFVRVDLYEINSDIYFGEYTFTPAAGVISYYKQKALDYLGEKLDLTKYKPETKGCDIIVPVYNAYDCLSPCIDSILKNTNLKVNRLLLIDDKSPDERVLPLLEKYEKISKKIILLKNEKNLGFVKTVNKAMNYSNKNIVLLNSDTIVSKGWLTEMVKCSNQNKKIATVTPFSNNLTPMKPLPESFRKQGFPNGFNFEQMANLVKKCSLNLFPELPTSHGFCMYIKRAALDMVGDFDEDNFGKGYGEENDFSFRCLEFGYKHILCDNVCILHTGSQSFLQNKTFHNEALIKKHPQAMQMTGAWYQKHEIDIITDNIVLALSAKENRINILITPDATLKSPDLEIIKKLKNKYNIHLLESESGNYVLHSFFKDADLKTAIYRQPVIIGKNASDEKEHQKMIDELKDIYGISIIIDSLDEDQITKKCQTAQKQKIDYLRARNKLIEYDFIQDILRGEELKRAENEKNKPQIEQTPKIKQKKLTIPQRICLKIRYILLGR